MTDKDREKPLSDHLAADTDRGSKGLGQLLDRLDRHTRAKQRLQQMVSHLEQLGESDKLASDLRKYIKDCSTFLAFHHYYRLEEYKLVSANFCKRHLVCPSCAMRRSARALRTLSERFNTIMESTPNLTPYMITWTVKNGFDLSERYTHLNESLKRISARRRKEIQRKNLITEYSKVMGSFGSHEFTYSDETGWHPHHHEVALLNADNLIDPARFSEQWLSVTGDSFITDVRPLTRSSDGTFTKSLLEVTKYALKFSSLSVEKNYEAYSLIKGKRLFRTMGLFHGVQVPEDYQDHDAYLLDEPYIKMIYSWLHEKEYKLTLLEEQQSSVIPTVGNSGPQPSEGVIHIGGNKKLAK